MRKWRLPLTYQPKIEPVLLGTCRQTIRMGRKKQVGDLIRFYVWTGKAYRSKQLNLTNYEPLIDIVDITIMPSGISGLIVYHDTQKPILVIWEHLSYLAELDGIVPPTGEALRDVLISKNGKIPSEGIEAQILRW